MKNFIAIGEIPKETKQMRADLIMATAKEVNLVKTTKIFGKIISNSNTKALLGVQTKHTSWLNGESIEHFTGLVKINEKLHFFTGYKKNNSKETIIIIIE